jgi:GNAT superfamily N-acetyltransferase
MKFELRKATRGDIPTLNELIAESVRGLARGFYSDGEIERSIVTVFGVDRELIDDGTYFVAVADGGIVGCGGWSRRTTLYGADRYGLSRDANLLNPALDAAKIRAFFIRPTAARKGIGKAILEECEREAVTEGFATAELMATLPGVPLYEACGYAGCEGVLVPLGGDLALQCISMNKRLV